MRLKATLTAGLLAALASVGLPGTSRATVVPPMTYAYTVSGSYDLLAEDPFYSGTLTAIGPSTDQITAADITLSNPSLTFTDIFFQGVDGSGGFILDLTNGSFFLSLDFANASDLFDGKGTDVGVGVLLNSNIPIGDDFSGDVGIAVTPIPAALPLFAGGLGLVGYLARRRKKNSTQAVA